MQKILHCGKKGYTQEVKVNRGRPLDADDKFTNRISELMDRFIDIDGILGMC